MNNYQWSGINSQGVKVTGQCAAQGAAALKMQLRNQGIIPLQVKITNNHSLFVDHKIKPQMIIIFLQQLSTLISADIPLTTSLEIIAQGHKNITMQQLLLQIKNDVINGVSLANAFAQHPRYFSKLTCALIAAGEESGTLAVMLNRLVNHQENILKIKNNMIKILIYPLTVIIIALLVTILLLMVAVPQFENLFASLNAPLPMLTKYMLAITKYIQNYDIAILIFILSLFAIVHLSWKHSNRFVDFTKQLLLKVPLIGPTLQKIIVVRITHTLATIVAAGIPLMQALHMVSTITDNKHYTKALVTAEKEVGDGRQLHITLKDSQLFPSTMIQMIAIGEDSGTLDKMLFKITDWYNEQIDHTISRISVMLEPVIMLILALLIGSIVTAMYLPIFKLGNII